MVGEANAVDTSAQMSHFQARRALLGGLAALPLIGPVVVSGFQNKDEIADSAEVILGRESLQYSEVYTPPNPLELLSREASDHLFDSLELADKYPTTITKDAFHTLIQRPARVATLFFRPENKADLHNEAAFATHCEGFFRDMQTMADDMKVDFVGTLLMYQVSGDNTNSVKAQRSDVRDEQVRAGSTVVNDLFGAQAGILSMGALRTLKVGQFYSYPRIEGPVTMGLAHDIEIVMIARALVDLEKTNPDAFSRVSTYLEERSPQFAALYRPYVEHYRAFETLSQDIRDTVYQSADMQAYIAQFATPDALRSFLTKGNHVDDYQLSRTTTYWATISQLQALYPSVGYDARPAIMETQALEQTIDRYMKSGSATGFVLEQINNPKMLKQLKKDAKQGVKGAQQLLDLATSFAQAGDALIAEDRNIAAALISEKTETDYLFQLVTGVSYARWLLNDAYAFTHGAPAEDLRFSDPNELAYHAFLGNLNRESAASFSLQDRPLNQASLTFGDPAVMFERMALFIDRVYKPTAEAPHPQKDFRQFAAYGAKLIFNPFVRASLGIQMDALEVSFDAKEKVLLFLNTAQKYGAYDTIHTPPHSSFMRAIEAVMPYSEKMEERHD